MGFCPLQAVSLLSKVSTVTLLGSVVVRLIAATLDTKKHCIRKGESLKYDSTSCFAFGAMAVAKGEATPNGRDYYLQDEDALSVRASRPMRQQFRH